MTDEKLKKANELKEFIEQTSEKLSDMTEVARLANTPYESRRIGECHCVDVVYGELKVRYYWNQNENEHGFDETTVIPTHLIPIIRNMVYEDMKASFEKAKEEYDKL